MLYDNAYDHADADVEGLPPEAGATHIGLFLAWATLKGLGNPEVPFDAALHNRAITPGRWLFEVHDGKFVSDALSSDGNAFALAYYQESKTGGGSLYFEDYMVALDDHMEESFYQVPDTWESFDEIAPTIDESYRSWKTSR